MCARSKPSDSSSSVSPTNTTATSLRAASSTAADAAAASGAALSTLYAAAYCTVDDAFCSSASTDVVRVAFTNELPLPW
ncbi:hypothetical protein NESM_000935500 [Novymonas esmeraldas]|uniref:Secreted protein n=1 Tax=Novymonas esmeraldas TaxID=1808958 RepID=A0AAW0F2T4_9TRYP